MNIYSNDLGNPTGKKSEGAQVVDKLREHVNSPKFCETNSSKHENDIYSNDLENWNVKQGVNERSVDKLREHVNSPKFCETNSSKQKNILGIDPSLTSLGWGVIDTAPLKYLDSGVIKTKSTESMHKRLALINSALQKIIEQYKPDIIAMEETFVNMNNVSSLKLGYARGAVMALIGKYDVIFQEFKPNVVKKSVTGYGHAEKNQILQMVKLLLPNASAINGFDEADALAIAYTSLVSTPKFGK